MMHTEGSRHEPVPTLCLTLFVCGGVQSSGLVEIGGNDLRALSGVMLTFATIGLLGVQTLQVDPMGYRQIFHTRSAELVCFSERSGATLPRGGCLAMHPASSLVHAQLPPYIYGPLNLSGLLDGQLLKGQMQIQSSWTFFTQYSNAGHLQLHLTD